MVNMPAVLRLRTGSRAAVSFEVPEMFRGQLWAMVEKAKTEYYQVKISRPKRPRTTGDKSQNHHINGHSSYRSSRHRRTNICQQVRAIL